MNIPEFPIHYYKYRQIFAKIGTHDKITVFSPFFLGKKKGQLASMALSYDEKQDYRSRVTGFGEVRSFWRCSKANVGSYGAEPYCTMEATITFHLAMA